LWIIFREFYPFNKIVREILDINTKWQRA
jgi:hypothetical protein